MANAVVEDKDESNETSSRIDNQRIEGVVK